VAERGHGRALQGAALGGATLLAGLVLLTQSRAALVALGASALVLLLVLPGRSTRFWALVTGAAALALALAVEPFASLPATTAVPVAEGTARDAGVAILAAATLAGLAWGAGLTGAAALGSRTPGAARILRIAAPAVLVLALAGGGLAAVGDPVSRVKDEYDAFRELDAPGEGSARVLSGGGNRYDYWRIAADQFTAHPVRGIGAGNYDRTYFIQRQTTENIRQPHSLELQLLGELGLVGFAALALFAGAVLAGLLARSRRGREGPLGLGLAVAAGGAFLAWLAHTSFDWLHLVPGVTGLALVAAAVLVGPRGAGRLGAPHAVAVALAALLVVVGALTLGRSTLAEHHRAQAREALPEDPERALDRARDALRLDDETLRGWYLGAAAQARLGDYRGAVATLREAAAREPHDFLTYALLGDLATRRGERAAARRWYGRASALNPRSTELAARARGEPPPQ
jgi:O-antigen ligase